nr:MAG TPA: hypothetical protein [Caudoviricetes sp.]
MKSSRIDPRKREALEASPIRRTVRNTNFDPHASSGTGRVFLMKARETTQAGRRRTPSTKCVTPARDMNRAKRVVENGIFH